MVETSEGEQDTNDKLKPESDVCKYESEKVVGSCAASLREIVNDDIEPEVPIMCH
jgi:hypothetical protein